MSDEQPPPPPPPGPLGPPPSWTPPPPAATAAGWEPDQPDQPDHGPETPHVVSLGPTPPPSRRTTVVVLAAVVAALVIVLAVAVPVFVGQFDDDDETAAAESATGPLSQVEVYTDLGNNHVEGDVDYPQSPPVGGEHDPVWLDCGAYDEPLRDENAVHDLEHGTVWLAYDPDLSADDVAGLEDQLPQNGIMAPYPGLDAPVVVTVWGRQLQLTGVDDDRLADFVRQFGHGETAPEPFASCSGGTDDPTGGGSGGATAT